MDSQPTPITSTGYTLLLQSSTSQLPELSPQHSHQSSTIEAAACWPASILNSCRQHGCYAYLSRVNSFFSRALARVDAERPPMFSITQPKNRPVAPKANHGMQTPRGFAVRVFKGPTLSSFPYNAAAKFDVGYRPSANNDPRQTQNWYPTRTESARQPLANIQEPPKPSRFGSWTENRNSRDTPRPAAAPNYADFIYERSLSSKSDVYSENDTSSTATFTPSSTFSPALSGDSSLTSTPSEVPYQSPTTTASTITPSSPRHPFPLHIPALTQAQSAIRGLFVHPNGDIPRQPNTSPAQVPAAPVSRTADLPPSSPPRFIPQEAARPASPNNRDLLSESPQPASSIPSEYFPPPASESEVGDAQRLAMLNAQQYNSAASAYYQAGLRAGDAGIEARGRREQSPDRANAVPMGSSSRSMASSSFPTESNDSQGRGVYESSSLAGNPPTFLDMATVTTEPVQVRLSPTASQPQRVAYVLVGILFYHSSGTGAPLARFSCTECPKCSSIAVGLNWVAPILGDRERAERARVLSDPGRYDELRGLNILAERQREAYTSAFAPGTQPRGIQMPEIPAVVRSDSNDSRTSPVPERTRRLSGNLWSSLPQLPDRRSPVQVPSRPASTPPLPRIDTSIRVSAPLAPPERLVSINGGQQQQSPPRRDVLVTQPQTPIATPVNTSRSRTPVAGPRVLPAEPQRRRSDGDQPLERPSTSLLKRTSAIFHRSSSPDNSAPREPPASRPSRAGALPLDPQRRRSDGFQSVVPPRPQVPVQGITVVAAPRNVRWNENLVCPSPIFASQRRKGWFNRRGDQLWTNDGAYKPALPGQEFPPDLRDYPAYGSGWMNEEGVRIDMGHRLIPKAPLRSALKQTQPRGPVIQVEHGN
ncbi:hypothetical protein MVEN_01392200 [Mycena venus]|uniref:Uncharacterized protein n=1 Tax=Mycena venus TaxID=2733690 RepID=A0A8H7CUI7_9AGAR|nr:hypothetical protein MVEN_01392200 [Mycena venus]